MERIPFPSFNGKQESWAEFKQVLKELMRASGKREVLEMAQLASKLPSEETGLIVGIAEK